VFAASAAASPGRADRGTDRDTGEYDDIRHLTGSGSGSGSGSSAEIDEAVAETEEEGCSLDEFKASKKSLVDPFNVTLRHSLEFALREGSSNAAAALSPSPSLSVEEEAAFTLYQRVVLSVVNIEVQALLDVRPLMRIYDSSVAPLLPHLSSISTAMDKASNKNHHRQQQQHQQHHQGHQHYTSSEGVNSPAPLSEFASVSGSGGRNTPDEYVGGSRDRRGIPGSPDRSESADSIEMEMEMEEQERRSQQLVAFETVRISSLLGLLANANDLAVTEFSASVQAVNVYIINNISHQPISIVRPVMEVII
jgi:hypothetical protein